MAQRRWFIRPYVDFMSVWLRYGKPTVSGVSSLLDRQDPVDLKARWAFSRLRAVNPATLGELADWLARHTEWVSDPLYGLVDLLPTAEHIEWQLNHGDGIFRDDCDGLAYLSALAVRPFCENPRENYLVTLVYDPTEVPVQGSAHVLNLFRHQGEWRVFSNAALDTKAWSTPCQALYDNSYYWGWCRGARLQYLEVRSAEMRPLAMGLPASGALFGCDMEQVELDQRAPQ